MTDAVVAVVTGAGRGIGNAIARRLVAAGWLVAVTDVDAAAASASAASLGDDAAGFPLDVQSWTSVERAAADIEASLGPVAALVNNAGITRVARSEVLPRESWDQVIDINLSGTWRCSQIFGSLMLQRSAGAIVNVGSAYCEIGAPGRAAYAATKTGILGLTRVLATEWAARGIRVNAVEPGYVDTQMMQVALQSGAADLKQVLGRIPAGRLATPEDIANAVALLLSEDAAYINGVAMPVDGGHLAYGGVAAVENVLQGLD